MTSQEKSQRPGGPLPVAEPIGGKTVLAPRVEIVRMPANVPHAVDAKERFKMVLLMIRD